MALAATNLIKGDRMDMKSHEREQNPDVNTYYPDADPSEKPDVTNGSADKGSDIEGRTDKDIIPVPPDVRPTAPIEEPPSDRNVPVGDVDDSPKRIA